MGKRQAAFLARGALLDTWLPLPAPPGPSPNSQIRTNSQSSVFRAFNSIQRSTARSTAFNSNCAQQDMTQVKGVFRTLFRWTSPALLSAGATNELLLENNVACDMPGQIPYMSWLILIMPLSTSMLNCAISFGKRRAGELFHSNRSA